MKTCAVIPAAGNGSRLGMSMPKLLVPISDEHTVWSIMRDKLLSVVDHIHIIISPKASDTFSDVLSSDLNAGKVSISLQPEPLGMGDAIMCGYPIWSQAQTILVVWGDQVNVSQQTLQRAIQAHAGINQQLIIPVTHMASPYVEYVFAQNALVDVKQSREGELCSAIGYADVGSFVLSVATLYDAWYRYLQTKPRGLQTGEINFLPFLVYLCKQNWRADTIIVSDNNEARGINTPEDLIYFQQLYKEQGRKIS